jgi:hypothetical protein
MRVEMLEDRQLLATIIVNTAADDATPGGATLSLREAIEVSDGTLAVSSLSTQEQALVTGAVGASNTIGFNIPTTDSGYNAATGVWTIALQSALPKISTNAAIINGYSQKSASENTLSQGDNAKLTIAINGGGQQLTGLTIAQQGSQVSGLDIENCLSDGVLITAGGDVQVMGCFIGTDPTGEIAAPNAGGVLIENSFNTIGGPNVGDRNVISGNDAPAEGYGVLIPEQSLNPLNIVVTGTLIENNFIGIDAAGTKALSNGASGVYDSGTGNTYGGTTAGLGNVISGNAASGIKSTGSITIEGNYIGTDATGNAALGNGSGGDGIINEGGPGAAISTLITNNVVSGNLGQGISVSAGSPSSSTYTISNNMIGTNATGTAALGNGSAGLALESLENATVLNNVISANLIGLQVSGFGADVGNNVFQGNLIGTDITGLVALGNTDLGVDIDNAIGDTFGGTGQGQANVVALNDGDGIEVYGGTQNQFNENSIFGNAGAGIYLTAGANDNPAAPTLTYAGGMLSGTLEGTPGVSYVVAIYSNPTLPAVGQEQGKTFVRDVTVVLAASKIGTFSVAEPSGIYTANATDSTGNSSEFSKAISALGLPGTTTAVSSSSNPSTFGQKVTFTAVVSASGFEGTPTGTVIFTIDGQAETPVALSVVGGVDEAQFATSTLTAGPHTVAAAYSGDAFVDPSNGSLPMQTVNSASSPSSPATTTAVSSSSNPSTVGQQVTFTAVVTGAGAAGKPTGTVTFTIDGHAQTAESLAVVGGVDEAQFATSTLTVGQHSVLAAYSGDSTFPASAVASPLSQVVNAIATATTLTSSENASNVGDQVVFTVTVAPSSGSGTPSGDVTFSIDGVQETPVAIQVVNGHDQAVFSISTLSAGQHAISATYDGDSTFGSSIVGAPLAQTVIGAAVADGPTVALVQRFGIHMEPTVLVATFNSALDPVTAQNLRNYVIVGPSGRHVAIRSAVYDSATNTVTLRPTEKINLHHNYQFTIVGTGQNGVGSVSHTLLDGEGDGGPGSDFVTTLNWKSVVLTPAQARRLHAQSQAKPAGALAHRFAARKL